MTTPAGLTIADARAALAAQAFSGLVGAELERFAPDETILTIALRPDHLQQHGLVHGGLVAYAADNAMAFGAGSVLGPSVVSAGFNISFLAPARGSLLVATASLVTTTKRAAVVRCTVHTEDEAGASTTCAAAQGAFTLMRQQPLRDDAAQSDHSPRNG